MDVVVAVVGVRGFSWGAVRGFSWGAAVEGARVGVLVLARRGSQGAWRQEGIANGVVPLAKRATCCERVDGHLGP